MIVPGWFFPLFVVMGFAFFIMGAVALKMENWPMCALAIAAVLVVICIGVFVFPQQDTYQRATVGAVDDDFVLVRIHGVPVMASPTTAKILPGDEVTVKSEENRWFITSFVHREEVTEAESKTVAKPEFLF